MPDPTATPLARSSLLDNFRSSDPHLADKVGIGINVETDRMTTKWLTLPAAADILGVSVKTVDRRIRAGRLDSRRTDDRRVEVLVEVPTTDGQMADAVVEQGQRQMQLASGTVAAWQRLAETGEARVADAKAETRRARQVGRWAWLIVGVLVIACGGGIWFIADQAGQLELSRLTVKNAGMALENGRRLAQERGEHIERLTGRLETERDRAAQASARAVSMELALVESEAATQVALAKHETVEAKLAVLSGEEMTAHATSTEARVASAGQ